MAEDIGKLGTIFAILTFHVLMLRFIIEGLFYRKIDLYGGGETAGEIGCTADGCFEKYASDWFNYMIIAIVIIVVAVPEGLPLAVMISLAFAIGRMLNDHCDVKKLASCEIMGGADNICSDKTGTLTNNKMEVVRMWVGKDIALESSTTAGGAGKLDLTASHGVSAGHVMTLLSAIDTNIPGNPGPTDKAMVLLMQRSGYEKGSLDE